MPTYTYVHIEPEYISRAQGKLYRYKCRFVVAIGALKLKTPCFERLDILAESDTPTLTVE